MNGTKSFISDGDFSDVYIVMRRSGADRPDGISAVLVDAGSDGLSFGAQERNMGWRAQPTAHLQLDTWFQSSTNLLGQEGDGFKYARPVWMADG